MPTIGGLYCAVGEFPSGDGEIEPAWARLLNPALLLKNIMTPGGADQKESAEYFTAREPFRRLSERDDVLVYETEPLDEPVEVTGPIEIELWIASSAVDTDFTAKLIDVYPPNEDYPEGYDLILNDSVIRTRYREGFDREVLMEPGTPYRVTIRSPPTSNLFAAGPPDPRRRLVVELPSPRAEPEHGRADRPAHPSRRRRADGLRRCRAPFEGRPPGRPELSLCYYNTNSLRPRFRLIASFSDAPRDERACVETTQGHFVRFAAVPGGAFAFGVDPARLYPPEPDEGPRRTVRLEAFRISRLPVTDGDGVPLTYVSRADAEAWCAARGVRLPTEAEWEAAARGGDDRLWPWGDELPDTTRATFGQGIGGPSRAGLHPAGAAPCGALDLAGNVWEWTSDGAARGGSFLSGPGELRATARYPAHPDARDPYVGFRAVAVEPTVELDWVEVPAGEYVLGRDPDETPAAVRGRRRASSSA